MEEKTLAGVIMDVEKVVSPLGFKIMASKKCYMTGPFSWNTDEHTEGSRPELKLTIIREVDTSLKETVGSMASELEKLINPLMFEIVSLEKRYYSKAMPPFIDTKKAILTITLVHFLDAGLVA
jgi:hypothetical protein